MNVRIAVVHRGSSVWVVEFWKMWFKEYTAIYGGTISMSSLC